MDQRTRIWVGKAKGDAVVAGEKVVASNDLIFAARIIGAVPLGNRCIQEHSVYPMRIQVGKRCRIIGGDNIYRVALVRGVVVVHNGLGLVTSTGFDLLA